MSSSGSRSWSLWCWERLRLDSPGPPVIIDHFLNTHDRLPQDGMTLHVDDGLSFILNNDHWLLLRREVGATVLDMVVRPYRFLKPRMDLGL